MKKNSFNAKDIKLFKLDSSLSHFILYSDGKINRQVLNISFDGSVSLDVYRFYVLNAPDLKKTKTRNFSISKENTEKVFACICKYVSTYETGLISCDTGSWCAEITTFDETSSAHSIHN